MDNNVIKIDDPEKEIVLLKEIQDWLKEKSEITQVQANDKLKLLYFLRGTKYDIEKSKRKIEGFNDMRLKRTEWFTNRNPFLPELEELFQIGIFLPLPQKDELNRQVIIIRTAAHNPKKHLQNDVFKCCKMILDLLLTMDESISFHGIVAIFDMTAVTWQHALQLTPTLIKRSVESWQLYPCKIKLLEFVNAPPHVNLVLNTFRLFMTPKMKSRVVLRTATSEVKTELPVDLGGSGKSYQQLAQEWKSIIENNATFFNQK